MQQHQILQTKLYVPPIRPELVSRLRLIERLNAGLDHKITVISAPAGFGKTTLVSEWVHTVRVHHDAPLPLARLRAQGQLTEVRATDLCFTSSEAAEFLNRAMGLNLSAKDIAAMETHTEGWIAGLQLAAISMRGQKDASSFIRSWHRFMSRNRSFTLSEQNARQDER